MRAVTSLRTAALLTAVSAACLTGRVAAQAPAGAYDYVINGRMIAGFALVAFPAEYGRTGIKTFIVNHYRIVYEKDLGRSTPTIAATMAAYDPDRSWRAVEDE